MIDAHHHLWQYNDRDYKWMSGAMGGLRRDYLVADLESVTREAGVTGTIAVQARQSLVETEWLLDLAAQHPLILGVVGWAPLCSPKVEDELERLAQHKQLRSVRHVLHDEPDDFFMLRDDFNCGVSLLRNLGLAYDILIFERHLPQTIDFVDRHPGQVFVVDHIAKPRIKDRVVSPWRENIARLAKRENVYCKVSGMATEADWSAWTSEQMRPYFDTVLEAFGPKRLMFGSDWPVLTLAGSYRQWVDTFRSYISELSENEQREMSEGTARRAYRL